MKRLAGVFLIAIFLSVIVYAQYSKYDVLDYFRLIPVEKLTDSFLDLKATQNATLEEDREDIVEAGLSSKKVEEFYFNTVIDIKNGYISARHYYIQELMNEFVVWKSRDKKDLIGISTRLDFKKYAELGEARGGYNEEYGVAQNLAFYTYENGIFNLTDNFVPSRNYLFNLARKKFPDLRKDPIPSIVYLLPRNGTKVRIINYILPKVKTGKIIIRDIASLNWNGTTLKFSEKP